jgi:prevent-host-death family protein
MMKIPISRFRRELRRLLRILNNNQEEVIFITRKGVNMFVLVSVKHYEESLNNPLQDIKQGLSYLHRN